VRRKAAQVHELQTVVVGQAARLETLEAEAMRRDAEASPFDALAIEAAAGEADAIFAACDKNRDGLLSHSEIKAYLRESPWAIGYIHSSRFHWAELWEGYDPNLSGRLQLTEFRLLYLQKLHPLIHAQRGLASVAEGVEPSQEDIARVASATVIATGGDEYDAASAARSAAAVAGASDEKAVSAAAIPASPVLF